MNVNDHNSIMRKMTGAITIALSLIVILLTTITYYLFS